MKWICFFLILAAILLIGNLFCKIVIFEIDDHTCTATETASPEYTIDDTINIGYTFDDLLDAIEWVESKGDAGAVGDNGDAVGAYQIHEIYVDDVNMLCGDLFTYEDRWDKAESRIMTNIYLRWYASRENLGREPTLEDAARIHNGGPDGWKKESTKPYWLKVKARIEPKTNTH